MVQSLEAYIQDATNYLGFEGEASERSNRQKILAFCVKHKLDEKFLTLVAENNRWQDLAANTGVKYLIDVLPQETLGSHLFPQNRTFISLRIFDVLNPVPVIKIGTTKAIL